jgi:hypothetical protein
VSVEPIAPYREPVRKSIAVKCTPAHAFSVFTESMSSWWPLATHSLSTDRATGCGIEPRVGGNVYEVRDDGERISWGWVTAWEPPARFVMKWHPGHERSEAQEVEVRFTPVAGGTRVDLEHRGWEALGASAAEVREGYNNGWEGVFVELFAAACAAAR